MSSPRILFLSTQLPYPPMSGGTIKSWNYLKDLAQRYDVSLACLLKEDDEQFVAELKENISLKNQLYIPLCIKRNALTLVKSYFGYPCLNVYRNYSKTFKSKVNQFSKVHDLILVDHYEMFQYVPKNFTGKVVLHTHNAEFMLWERMGELESNPLKKWVLKNEAIRIKKYEKIIFKQADLIYSTPSDIAIYKSHGIDVSKHKFTYHLGNDHLLSLPDIKFEATELAITFIGTLSWEPNIDGICWFIKEVWPSIKGKHESVKLYVLGKSPNQRIIIAANEDPQIIFTGFVTDLDSYLQKTRVYIVPLRFGSGMKVKVLEGLYRGVPMVTTNVGAEGLNLIHQQEVMIADYASNFASSCLQLIENENTWNTLRDKSRKIAAEKYTWKPLFSQMNIELRELIK